MNFIAANSEPLKNTGQIKLHTAEDFDAMHKVGQMAARTLDELSPFVVPSMTKRWKLSAIRARCQHLSIIAALKNQFVPR